MTLFEKIKSIYPELEAKDFHPAYGSVLLVNDGGADYIAKWDHPTLPRPTQEQLDAVKE